MLSIGKGVKEYLQKAGTDAVVVKLIPNRILVCCGGRTRKYYTPDIRLAKLGERFDNRYEKLAGGGVYMFITPQALAFAEGDLEISLEEVFVAKKLSLAGIPPIVYAG